MIKTQKKKLKIKMPKKKRNNRGDVGRNSRNWNVKTGGGARKNASRTSQEGLTECFAGAGRRQLSLERQHPRR